MKPVESFDRRGFGRRKTNISAQVRIGYRVVACTIKDLSEGGALLELAEHIELPQRLWLSWPEQKSEIACDVRHARLNLAGVQFLRPQTLTLRPALAPSDPVMAHPTPAPKSSERTNSAFDLVAERRRASRQAPAAAIRKVEPSQLAEPPRDLSTLMRSLNAAAQSIAEARAAASVPRPLAARVLAGAALEPPAAARVQPFALPLPASRYGDAAEATVVAGQARSLRSIVSALCAARQALRVPLPLAAAAYAESAIASASRVPMPLPAHALAAGTRSAIEGRLQPCSGHACALTVWRALGKPPPRPMAAWTFGKIIQRPVA